MQSDLHLISLQYGRSIEKCKFYWKGEPSHFCLCTITSISFLILWKIQWQGSTKQNIAYQYNDWTFALNYSEFQAKKLKIVVSVRLWTKKYGR